MASGCSFSGSVDFVAPGQAGDFQPHVGFIFSHGLKKLATVVKIGTAGTGIICLVLSPGKPGAGLHPL